MKWWDLKMEPSMGHSQSLHMVFQPGFGKKNGPIRSCSMASADSIGCHFSFSARFFQLHSFELLWDEWFHFFFFPFTVGFLYIKQRPPHSCLHHLQLAIGTISHWRNRFENVNVRKGQILNHEPNFSFSWLGKK